MCASLCFSKFAQWPYVLLSIQKGGFNKHSTGLVFGTEIHIHTYTFWATKTTIT